ncbi:hypothetical protein [Mucilaginibacter myungsuensis]|uniref:Uncharacterized protein n=1 Tax=Mucilaginibacter myungsuensis TaxID=649104 RepID=A0A929PY88_9SPHI|nr:hypothetical protein [Mucilaginibacter myungsuensis]MBE9663981.1 hypothetical protein [Mucilaginibacter myungsuensis]MDN3601160.1 hypothetical protein [Mucilaginibacter myungsuensis]
MVEVFKTDVQQPGTANVLIVKLTLLFPGSRVNFDLDDCDRVLRVEGDQLCRDKIAHLLKLNGYFCQELI